VELRDEVGAIGGLFAGCAEGESAGTGRFDLVVVGGWVVAGEEGCEICFFAVADGCLAV
jgi:hypothetical protein